MFITYRATMTSLPPRMQMLGPNTGISVWKHQPRGFTSPRWEIRVHLKDVFLDLWETITREETYASEAEAIKAAEGLAAAYTSKDVEEQVWPKSVDSKRRKA